MMSVRCADPLEEEVEQQEVEREEKRKEEHQEQQNEQEEEEQREEEEEQPEGQWREEEEQVEQPEEQWREEEPEEQWRKEEQPEEQWREEEQEEQWREPQQDMSLDDSLTSLQWLQEFSYLGGSDGPRPLLPQPHPLGGGSGGDAPASPTAGDPATRLGAPLTPGRPTAAALARGAMHPSRGHCPEEVDYRTDPRVKPPYSYAALICMAMQASRRSKLTLSCIYKWVTDNFCYFRYAEPSWRNSIRHNLSLNKCFVKVPRQKDEPGKGGFWKIDPQHAEILLTNAFRRRGVAVQLHPALRAPPTTLRVGPEAQHLLREFEEATKGGQGAPSPAGDQNWDPWHRSGPHKRKQGKAASAAAAKATAAKAPRRSSSPLLSPEEQRELGSLKGIFDWDSLLDSDLSGDLCLEGPVAGGEDGAQVLAESRVRNRAADLEEETFLATSLLENPWTEEEENSHSDFLCSSAVNLDQLLALGDSLGMDLSNKIDTLL